MYVYEKAKPRADERGFAFCFAVLKNRALLKTNIRTKSKIYFKICKIYLTFS